MRDVCTSSWYSTLQLQSLGMSCKNLNKRYTHFGHLVNGKFYLHFFPVNTCVLHYYSLPLHYYPLMRESQNHKARITLICTRKFEDLCHKLYFQSCYRTPEFTVLYVCQRMMFVCSSALNHQNQSAGYLKVDLQLHGRLVLYQFNDGKRWAELRSKKANLTPFDRFKSL